MFKRRRRKNKKLPVCDNSERKKEHLVSAKSDSGGVRFFDNVPKSVCAMVASYLPYQGHARFAETCRFFRGVCELSTSWFSLTRSYNVTHRNIVNLSQAPFNLTSATFRGTFNLKSCHLISKMVHLTEVNVECRSHCVILDMLPDSLSNVRRLKVPSLIIHTPHLLMQKLSLMKHLTDLSLVVTVYIKEHIGMLDGISGLRRLELFGDLIDKKISLFNNSNSFANLTCLRLYGFEITSFELDCISKIQLIELGMVYCKTRCIPPLPRTVEHLDLSYLHIADPDDGRPLLVTTNMILTRVVGRGIPLRKFGARGFEVTLFPRESMRVDSLEYLDIWGAKLNKSIVATISSQFPNIKRVHVRRLRGTTTMISWPMDFKIPEYYDYDLNDNWLSEV